jgi:lipoate-protein ligase A
MGIQILFTEDTAENIMQKDHDLLESLADQPKPILHLYRWKNPSITYGHFIKIEKLLQLDVLKELHIDLAKRPTGGGVILHVYDLAFSFLLPASSPFFSVDPLKNYQFVHQIVFKALKEYLQEHALAFLDENPQDLTLAANFCMAKPTIYDLMVGSKKIVGAAQRKKKNGYLHQGSIAIEQPDREFLKKILIDAENVSDKMESFSHSFFSAGTSKSEIESFKERVLLSIQKSFLDTFSGE